MNLMGGLGLERVSKVTRGYIDNADSQGALPLGANRILSARLTQLCTDFNLDSQSSRYGMRPKGGPVQAPLSVSFRPLASIAVQAVLNCGIWISTSGGF